MTGHIPPGQRECSHCSGYGSSLREEQDRCSRCGGSGLVADPFTRETARCESLGGCGRVFRILQSALDAARANARSNAWAHDFDMLAPDDAIAAAFFDTCYQCATGDPLSGEYDAPTPA